MDLSDQLLLERDIQQLQQDKTRLEDNLERKKRELLAALDLVKKEADKLRQIQDEQVKVLDRIRDEKLAWAAEKRQQEEDLDSKQAAVTKILNRETFVKIETQKLVKQQEAVKQRELIVAEHEAARQSKLDAVVARETAVASQEKALEKQAKATKAAAIKLKEQFLKTITAWEV